MKNSVLILIFGLIFIFFIFLSINVNTCIAEGNTIYVDDSGGSDFINIQDAINNANNSDINHPEALSNLLSLMETIALKLGEKHINFIELGKSAIYSVLDKYNRILFVLKCDKHVKRKKVDYILKQVIHEFINKFDGNLTKSTNEKEKLMWLFIKVIKKIFGESNKIMYFVEELRVIL